MFGVVRLPAFFSCIWCLLPASFPSQTPAAALIVALFIVLCLLLSAPTQSGHFQHLTVVASIGLGCSSILPPLLQFDAEDVLGHPGVIHAGDMTCSSKLPQHQHTFCVIAIDVGTFEHFLVCDVVLPVYT